MIELPPVRCPSPNRHRHKPVAKVEHSVDPVHISLRSLLPLRFHDTNDPAAAKLFSHLLARYHYLGYTQPVGENLRYLISSNDDRPLACLLFGSAAWKCAARDQFIGWNHEQRQRFLPLTANNHRFLILPWVQVKCLASHLLALTSRRIADDWKRKYGHRLLLLETFVDRQRFAGTCYRAANWRCVGQTKGRSRQDRFHKLRVPVKDVYLYPLIQKVQEHLCK